MTRNPESHQPTIRMKQAVDSPTNTGCGGCWCFGRRGTETCRHSHPSGLSRLWPNRAEDLHRFRVGLSAPQMFNR
jgi:hypothetical protein